MQPEPLIQAKGIIALDIDGTLTEGRECIPAPVIAFLQGLYYQGWKFIFITGRTFKWAFEVLQALPFPYGLAVNNGAIILEMPQQKVLRQHLLDTSCFSALDAIYENQPSDYVLYSGFLNNDICYYRPQRFAPALLDYLRQRTSAMEEVWEPVASFDQLPVSNFVAAKGFGTAGNAASIADEVHRLVGLSAPVIRDPYQHDYFVIQATPPGIDKGSALKDYAQYFPSPLPVIAAGDDENDIPMLNYATVKIVMRSAPLQVQAYADILAPTAQEKGLMPALSMALERLASRDSCPIKDSKGATYGS